jgi:phage terminase Nu1 subunit (DNA packaging protein)
MAEAKNKKETKKKPKESERISAGTAILAADFGVTKRRIQQLVEEGVLTGTKEKSGYSFDYRLAVSQYVKHLAEKAAGKDRTGAYNLLEHEKLEAEVSMKRSKAVIAEMDLAEFEGKMHRADDVAEMTSELVYAVRNALMSMPGRLAVDMAKTRKAAEASQRIRQEVGEILKELAMYEYNPSDYHEKVKERQGWQNDVRVKEDDA